MPNAVDSAFIAFLISRVLWLMDIVNLYTDS